MPPPRKKRPNTNFRLKLLGLPEMQKLDDFSELTHVSKYTLYRLSRYAEKYYKVYDIPKKSGKPRTICQPNRQLKAIQGWILINILNKLKSSELSRGFEKGTSIAHNAEPHKYANVVLTVDLKDFFTSIPRNKVYGIFRSIGYDKTIAVILTNLCTYKGGLPQGSPCSPKLANLATWSLDIRIQGLVGKRGITYTRYADDLTFSTQNPSRLTGIISPVKAIIKDENLEVNHKKTRIAGQAKPKIVTGLVIANDTVGIGRDKFRTLRAKINKLTLPTEQTNVTLLSEAQGWLSFVYDVDYTRYKRVVLYVEKLRKKYPSTLVARLSVKSKPKEQTK